MQQFARAELSKRAFFTLEQTCKKLAYSNLKKDRKRGIEEQSAAYYSYRIFVTIDVELVVILIVIDLLIFTKLCISCFCLLQDHFRPSEVSIFGSGRDNNFWKNIACNRYKNIPRSWVVTH